MATPEQIAAGLDPKRLDYERLMRRIVATVETNTKRVTPVRTGNLRRSITSTVMNSGRRGVVGTNVIYAPPVHRRNPFLENGLAMSRGNIETELEQFGLEFVGGVG